METYELELLRNMTDQQRMYFQTQFNSVRKNPTTGLLLAFFLGGVGAHHFYLGNVGLGILYAVFFWTFIPAFIALIECFLIMGRVERWNAAKATEIATQVRVLYAAPAAAAAN
jgi:TM2 domain-containing membrane protein YozV